MQTSNEQLDGLSARAQALRAQDGFLTGEHTIALAGRPYGLYAGDEIVPRAASVHPQFGAIPNGTRGRVLDVADDSQRVVLALSDGRQGSWERGQLDAGSARLAYVSHTFPAQGQTVDRAHVIAEPLADANGTYVALTRAREQTHLYASRERLDSPAGEGGGGGRETQVARLAEQLGRSEPDIPSISIALAHEQHAEREHAQQTASPTPSESDQRGQARVRREQAHAELERSRVELDQARGQLRETAAVMATQPGDPRVAFALADAQHAAQQARQAAARGEQLTAERAELGRLARLGDRGRALKTRIATERDREHAARAAQQRHRQEADIRQVELDQRLREWAHRHPGAPARHQAAEHAYELAQHAHQAVELADMDELLAATQPPAGARLLAPEPVRPQTPNAAELPRRRHGRSGPTLGR